MRLTISGTPGSGKSVVGRYLSKKLNIKYYSVGELMRDFAVKKHMNLIDLSKMMEEDIHLDRNFNEGIKNLNKKDNFVLDSRLGFLFIKNAVHIFLDAEVNVRAKRIFNNKRKLENYKKVSDVKKEIENRFLSERKRFKRLYKLDFTNLDNYDLVIDTTKMNVKIISDIILKYLKK